MPSKFKIDNFEPLKIKKAKDILQKHLEALTDMPKERSDIIKKEPLKHSLWQKFLNFIKLG